MDTSQWIGYHPSGIPCQPLNIKNAPAKIIETGQNNWIQTKMDLLIMSWISVLPDTSTFMQVRYEQATYNEFYTSGTQDGIQNPFVCHTWCRNWSAHYNMSNACMKLYMNLYGWPGGIHCSRCTNSKNFMICIDLYEQGPALFFELFDKIYHNNDKGFTWMEVKR